jgi:hypothetical protein
MLEILEVPLQFDSASEFAQVFVMNKTLIHVDFSFNHFKEADCKVLAIGLKQNNLILGAHFTGNDFDCDA